MYEKVGFINGQVLTAEALNHMEEGIEKAGIGDATLAFDFSNTQAIKETFERYNLASRVGSIIHCRAKEGGPDSEYRPVLLVVEHSGDMFRLTFIALWISSTWDGRHELKAKLSDMGCQSYIIQTNGEVQCLGVGPFLIADEELNPNSTLPISNKALCALLTEYAKKIEVPTKVSQLDNDSDFVAKKDILTPDWNASTYKEGHIKNRTHHMQDYMCHYFKGSPIKVSKPSGTGYVLLTYDTDLADKFIRIEITAGESKTHEFLDAMGMPLIFTWDAGNSTINVESFMGAVETYGMRAYYSSSAKSFDEYFVKLDKGFIPEGAMSQNSMVSITYTELVVLKERGQLTAGTYYRITDYETTTTQANTRSAGHPFDVVVLALSESTLAEEAYAVHSARDTAGYFQRCNLSAWRLWYSLDNDTQRFAWADTENGKGVIYRMIDERLNDCPYDFKNIQFARYKLNAPEYNEAFTPFEKAVYNMVTEKINAGDISFLYAGLTAEGKIWEYEENVFSTAEGSVAWCYTFNEIQVDPINGRDLSRTDPLVINNKLEAYLLWEYGNYTLPNNVFLTEISCSNHFGFDVRNNTFTFVQRTELVSCLEIVASHSFIDVQLRKVSCSAFGNNIREFKAESSSNLFLGDRCSGNYFESCSCIVLGKNSRSNTFGRDCDTIVVEEGTIHKTISLNSNDEVKIFNLVDLVS